MSSKKIRFTSPTIFPPLLSDVDYTDIRAEGHWDTLFLPGAEDSTTLNLSCAEVDGDPDGAFEDLGWHNNENESLSDSSNLCASDCHLFPRLFSASSSPILSASVTGAYDDETRSAEKIPDFGHSLPEVDDLNFDTLFDQYLRSPSPPVPSSPKDATSELSKITLNALEPARSCDPAGPLTETLINPGPEDVQQREGGRAEVGDRHSGSSGSSGPCVRLRVGQPKITLRLKL
ncbi:hypothetical protein CLAIMM_14897 [Cladophialophora immunda]|nr:hypothetical protein CLAIMM_14897 [Cladophialophora immunda]